MTGPVFSVARTTSKDCTRHWTVNQTGYNMVLSTWQTIYKLRRDQ